MNHVYTALCYGIKSMCRSYTFQVRLHREISETTLVKTKRNEKHIPKINLRKVAGKLHPVKRKSMVESVENKPEESQAMKRF